jgi:hypothetical protein
MVSEFSIQPFRSQEEAQAYREGVGALPAQAAWMAGLMAPSSGISDFLGFYPEMPTEEQMIPTEQMPSFGENIANKQYLDAILQSAGVLGDAAYASIPLTGPYGAIAGTALKGIGAVGKASKGAKVRGIESLKESAESKNIDLSIFENPNEKTISLSKIVVPEKNVGEGSKMMQEIIDYADNTNQTITLTPSTDFGGSSVNRLKKFYKKFGFVENKGRNKDFQFRDTMYRSPKEENKGIAALPESEDYITAYHGTAADFDKFDIGKIGTGEGAQAYGHGLYFAEADEVGKVYKKALGTVVKYDGKPIMAVDKKVGTTGDKDIDDLLMMHFGDVKKAIAESEKQYENSLDILNQSKKEGLYEDYSADEELTEWWATQLKKLREIDTKNLVEVEDAGKLYEAKLKVTPDELLDLDKPLNKQSKVVQKKIDDLFETPISSLNLEESFVKSDFLEGVETIGDYIKELKAIQRAYPNPPPFTGNNLSTELKGLIGAKRTSELLESVGIKGNKYLDEFSRDAKGGTSNYVIFDDRVIEISKKFGVAIPVAGAMLLAQDQKMAAAQNDSLDL